MTLTIFMKEQFKNFSIFAGFWAISCDCRPSKKIFEAYFIILLHIQLQEVIFNHSVKSASKISKHCSDIGYLVKLVSISLNWYNVGTVPNLAVFGL